MYRLVAQKPLEFFQNHMAWSKSPDETFSPESGKVDNNGATPLKEPIKHIDEGMYCEKKFPNAKQNIL